MNRKWALSKRLLHLLYLPLLVPAPYADAAPRLGRGSSAMDVIKRGELYDEIGKVLIDGHATHRKRDNDFCWALEDPSVSNHLFCQCSDYQIRPIITQAPTPGVPYGPCAYNAPAKITTPVTSSPAASYTDTDRQIPAVNSTQLPILSSSSSSSSPSSSLTISASAFPSTEANIIPLWEACTPGTAGMCAEGSRCICKNQWYSQCREPIEGSYVPSGEDWPCALSQLASVSASTSSMTTTIPTSSSITETPTMLASKLSASSKGDSQEGTSMSSSSSQLGSPTLGPNNRTSAAYSATQAPAPSSANTTTTPARSDMSASETYSNNTATPSTNRSITRLSTPTMGSYNSTSAPYSATQAPTLSSLNRTTTPARSDMSTSEAHNVNTVTSPANSSISRPTTSTSLTQNQSSTSTLIQSQTPRSSSETNGTVRASTSSSSLASSASASSTLINPTTIPSSFSTSLNTSMTPSTTQALQTPTSTSQQTLINLDAWASSVLALQNQSKTESSTSIQSATLSILQTSSEPSKTLSTSDKTLCSSMSMSTTLPTFTSLTTPSSSWATSATASLVLSNSTSVTPSRSSVIVGAPTFTSITTPSSSWATSATTSLVLSNSTSVTSSSTTSVIVGARPLADTVVSPITSLPTSSIPTSTPSSSSSATASAPYIGCPIVNGEPSQSGAGDESSAAKRDIPSVCSPQSGNTISNLSSTAQTPDGPPIIPSYTIDPDKNGTYISPDATPDQIAQCTNVAAHQLQQCWSVLNMTGWITDWVSYNQAACDAESMSFVDCFLYLELGGGANCSSFTGRSQCFPPDARDFVPAKKVHGPQVYYIAFNIWNLQNWFFSYWLAIEGANILTSENVGAICRLLNLPLPKPFPLLEVLSVMAFALGLISPSGWGSLIPRLGERTGVVSAIEVPGEYLLRAVQQSPTLTRNLLATGDLSKTEVQTDQIESGLALIVSQLQTNIQNAILDVMGNFTLFMAFCNDGFFSTQIENLNTLQQNVTRALQTYVVSQALQDDDVIITRAVDTNAHELATNASAVNNSYDFGCQWDYDEWGMCSNWWYDAEQDISYGLQSNKNFWLNYTNALESLFDQGITTPELLFRGSQVCADAAGGPQGNAPGTELSTTEGVWNAECVSNVKICSWNTFQANQQEEFSDCDSAGDFALESCCQGLDLPQSKVPYDYLGAYISQGMAIGMICNGC